MTLSKIIPGEDKSSAAPPETRNLRRRTRDLLITLPVLVPLAIMLVTGFIGLDFGFHWDEKLLLRKVRESVDSGILLPKDFYNYPSMSYWLSFAGSGLALGSVLQEIDGSADVSRILSGDSFNIRKQFSISVESDANYLRVRSLFLIVSSLSVVWVYLIQLNWRGSWLEALLASSLMAFSWEVADHLRWIAPDAILMQFVTLTLLFTMLSHLKYQRKNLWLRLAAIAAGLACGTKYQAGIIIIPVLIVAADNRIPGSPIRKIIPQILELLLFFAGSYLITTPGTVLAPLEFARDVYFEVIHYQSGHVGSTVAAGFEHLRLNLIYLGLVFFSPAVYIAAMFALFAVIGAADLIIDSRFLAFLFLSFPVTYILFISMQNVMIVRNLLVVVPFLVMLSVRGVVFVWERLKTRNLRLTLAIIVGSAVLFNAGWLVHASETIYNRSQERFTKEAAQYINDNPDKHVFVSDQVWDDLVEHEGSQFTNVTRDPLDNADLALFYMKEGLKPAEWPANNRNLAINWFGPREINFNYYPGWQGDDRIVLMSMIQARKIGIKPVIAGNS